MNPAACQGKSSFLRWSDARRRAQMMRRRAGEAFNCYRCRECGSYHLGSQNTVFRAQTCAFKRRKAEMAMKEIDE